MNIREWLMVSICCIGVLILMAVLDTPIPGECKTVLHDAYGHAHEYVGQINMICPVKGGC